MIPYEQIFAGDGFAGIDASPLQLAICRASEGQPVDESLLSDAEVQAHFGCDRSRIGLVAPNLVCIIAGVRGGKSLLAVCGATRDVLAANTDAMLPHEIARHPIVAPTIDNADASFRLLIGMWRESPVLRGLIVDETADTLTVRRPSDGRVFEIVVVAAHRGGTALRSRWLAGFTLEEAAGFGIESQGAVVNAEELLRAGQARLLPGTQGRIITSPFGQAGLVWRIYQQSFGKPGRVCVVHAPTRAMNPSFPQETIDEIRARDPDGAAREYDAAWVDAESTYFDGVSLRRARRDGPLERRSIASTTYVAAWDAATRGNSWTLTVAHQEPNGRFVVDAAWQWTGSKTAPLSPKVVIKDASEKLAPYRVGSVYVDQWSVDALRDQAADVGLALIECDKTTTDAGYRTLSTKLANDDVELPPLDVLEQDLRGVRKRVTPGGVRIELPRTPDGRHCDFAPSVALAAHFAADAMAVSALATPKEEHGAWEDARGPASAVIVSDNNAAAVVIVAWVDRVSGEDPDVYVDGRMVRNPRWFEPRALLRVLAAADLPADLDDAGAIVEGLAHEYGATRAIVRGLHGVWRQHLPRLSVRDASEVTTDDESGVERLRQLIRAEQMRCDDRAFSAQLSTCAPATNARVRAACEATRLDIAGQLAGSPASRKGRFDR